VTRRRNKRVTVALIRALGHPVRREALRLLHRVSKEGMSATDMSHAMTEDRHLVNNHLRALRKAGAVRIRTVRIIGNVKENKYVSLVSTNATLLAVLDETEAEDASIRRG
jgi:DNA-binding transcriptional ArsR family regulator